MLTEYKFALGSYFGRQFSSEIGEQCFVNSFGDFVFRVPGLWNDILDYNKSLQIYSGQGQHAHTYVEVVWPSGGKFWDIKFHIYYARPNSGPRTQIIGTIKQNKFYNNA